MARYLIGTGARNWNSTAIWSDTSGGTGGFSVPTSADAVIFDANSGTGDLTLDVAAVCGSLNSSALTGIVTIKGSVYTLSIYGDLTVNGTLGKFLITGTSYAYIKGSSTITTNSSTFLALNRLYLDAVGATFVNGDDCNLGNTSMYHLTGTWNHGNFNISGGAYSATGTLILGSGVFSIINWNCALVSLTIGTSTVKIKEVIYTGAIFYNVESTGIYFNISGSCTFNNLTVNFPTPNQSYNNFRVDTNQTVNGILTITGANASNLRILTHSTTIGTPRTITVNGSIVASNVDFRDITLAGTANRDLSAITGGSGDCGGNSGITFTPAVKQYYKHLGGGTTTFKDATKWFSDAALTVAGRVPLPQDDWDCLAGSFNATTTFQIDCPRIGRSCNLEGVANAVTMQLMNAVDVYGSYVLGANITPSGAYYVTFVGIGNFDINTYNKQIRRLVFLQRAESNYTCKSNISSFETISINYGCPGGMIDFNDFNITAPIISLYAGSLYLGNGIITITNIVDTTWNYQFGNIFAEGSTIILDAISGSANLGFFGGNKTYNIVRFSGSHTGNFDITGSNTFAELIIDSGRKVRNTAGTTQNIGKLTMGAGASIDSVTAAQHTLNYTGSSLVECRGVTIKNSRATPANKWWAGASVDGGNNTNWRFAFFGKGLNYLNGTRVIQALRGKK